MHDWEKEIRSLHKEWDSPTLWPRIAKKLESEGRTATTNRWMMALAAGIVLTIGVSAAWMVTHHPVPAVKMNVTPGLLNQQALADVEASEAAYRNSIDRLAKLAEPAVEMPRTQLMETYRAKLDLLDQAIGELRSEAGANPMYAQVRTQLADLYRQKQETLQEVLDHAQQIR
jgi:hypothetical protein